MRILHLSNTVSDRGNGIVNVAVDLAIAQASAGHDVAFACERGGYISLLERFNVRVFLVRQTGAARAFRNSFALLRVLRTYRPQIIHCHMRSGLLLVAPWAKLLHIPIIAHVHNIHDRAVGLRHLPTRILAVSHADSRTIAAAGVPRDRIRIVLNGLIGSHRLPATPAPVQLHHPAITTVAGMMHRKGIAELMTAFETVLGRVPEAHLYLVGEGPERLLFEAQAAASPAAAHIHFEGMQADPRPYMLASEVFVLASRRESFGLALIEARQAGCAIVASDVDGIPELLGHGDLGLLVPPQDPSALAAAIVKLLIDETLRDSLKQRARENLEPFTTTRMAAEVFAVYNEVARS